MYLITVIKIYFDGHNAEELQYCENEEDFDECMEENISLPENIMGGEDGYHTTRLQFTVKEITKEEAKQMEIVIDTYNNL